MATGAKIRRDVARALAATLMVSGVLLVMPDPAGATINPPTFIRTWGTLGAGTTQFDTPAAVAIGPGNVVYTLDSVNNRVQVFTRRGNSCARSAGPAPVEASSPTPRAWPSTPRATST